MVPQLTTIDYGYQEVISTAQNAEDVLIFRVFRGKTAGQFVDIGAGDPNWDSVTNWLYRVGWRGINVEPNPDLHEILCQWRPRDINLNVGCSDSAGSLAFFQVGNGPAGQGWGLSTFDPGSADRARALGYGVKTIEVPVQPLVDILDRCDKHSGIDVLKVDVEGQEAAVLRSGDWRRHRPAVVVAEAVVPMSAVPIINEWGHILTDADYSFVMFDGVNGWFVANEVPRSIRTQFQAFVNCNDHYRRATAADFSRPEQGQAVGS